MKAEFAQINLVDLLFGPEGFSVPDVDGNE